ncbi:MAG: glycerate kinase [Planctomycetes bacterium]|nr:glycerate kinase [Planctomycetota bacterium]
MRVICAPDKFKQCCTAGEAAQALASGVLDVAPGAEVLQIPVADGGEGTLDALSGEFPDRRNARVQDALGREVDAQFAMHGTVALIESAQACGLARLDEAEYNPAITHTFGVGQLIKAALDAGANELLIGLGGSATNDGGSGMARALGVKFLDDKDAEIAPTGDSLIKLRKCDVSGLDPRLKGVKVRALCDVMAPMLGEQGASRTYVVQKGGTTRTMHKLEEGLAMLQYAAAAAGLRGNGLEPGTGAAGGLGFGIYSLLGGDLEAGADKVLDLIGFRKLLQGTDLVLTGEGSFDAQTEQGKLIAVLAEDCKAAGVPLVVLAGAVAGDVNIDGVTAAFGISAYGQRRQDSLNEGKANLRKHAAAVTRLLKSRR